MSGLADLLRFPRWRGAPQPPEGAHGQRNIDGSYFSIWRCQNGHHAVGDPNTPPTNECRFCSWAPDADPTEWTRCDAAEAYRFLYDLEGPSVHDGVGFRLLTGRH